MPGPPEALRQCPTRPDGAEVLIAQTVTQPMCQERQQRLYHKCWTCTHRNGAAGVVAAKLAEPVEAPVLDMGRRERDERYAV